MKIKKIKIKPFFIDTRGKMFNLLGPNVKILSVILITSKKSQIRANHYHKKDEHYSFIISGKMEYFYKTHSNNKLKKLIVKSNEIVYTPKGEIHAMRFVEDTTFLAFSIKKRDKKNYEKDTIRLKII